MRMFGLNMQGDGATCKRGLGVIVKDLGELHGPVLLFGGSYSNLQALAALIEQAASHGIPVKNMICTGDVVAYCANPEETTQAIRDLGCAVVAGNCEKQIAVEAENCGCGFDENSKCSVLSHGWYSHTLGVVSEGTRSWMATCPDIVTFHHKGRRYGVIHGGVNNISRFIWSVSPALEFSEEIAALEQIIGRVDGVIAGHSGIPFLREIGDKTWINAGAIGMPPNDGNAETRYVILDEAPQIRHLKYDFNAAYAAMVNAGLTQGYDAGLKTGLWPSEDTLPPELRR